MPCQREDLYPGGTNADMQPCHWQSVGVTFHIIAGSRVSGRWTNLILRLALVQKMNA